MYDIWCDISRFRWTATESFLRDLWTQLQLFAYLLCRCPYADHWRFCWWWWWARVMAWQTSLHGFPQRQIFRTSSFYIHCRQAVSRQWNCLRCKSLFPLPLCGVVWREYYTLRLKNAQKSKHTQKLKYTISMLESFEYFCQMSSKSIHITLSYTVPFQSLPFFETQCRDADSVSISLATNATQRNAQP